MSHCPDIIIYLFKSCYVLISRDDLFYWGGPIIYWDKRDNGTSEWGVVFWSFIVRGRLSLNFF